MASDAESTHDQTIMDLTATPCAICGPSTCDEVMVPHPLRGHRAGQSAEEVGLPKQGLPGEGPGVPSEAEGRQEAGSHPEKRQRV